MIAWVGTRLDLSTAVVKGVVTFYTMFFEEPVGEKRSAKGVEITRAINSNRVMSATNAPK